MVSLIIKLLYITPIYTKIEKVWIMLRSLANIRNHINIPLLIMIKKEYHLAFFVDFIPSKNSLK